MAFDAGEIANYSYAKLLLELIKLSHIHRYESFLIGEEEFEATGMVYPLYRFTVNPTAKLKVCIIAGVHGYEVAGSLSMLSLFDDPKKYFNKNICYHIYPVINPTAFDLRRRLDDDGKDLNNLSKRILKNKDYCEVRAFHSATKNIKFDALISLHEDMDAKKFYAYVFEKEPVSVYRKIIKSSSKYADILRKNEIYGAPSDGEGLIINHHDRSLEDGLYGNGQATVSLCTETPGRLKLETRIAINLDNILVLNKYLLGE